MYSGLVKSFSPLNAYQKSYYPQTMIFFIDDSKYVRGTFLVFHKNALDFNNSIFSKGWTESPCRSRWRLGRSGRGAGVASCDGAAGAAAEAYPRRGGRRTWEKEGGRKAALWDASKCERRRDFSCLSLLPPVPFPSARTVVAWQLSAPRKRARCLLYSKITCDLIDWKIGLSLNKKKCLEFGNLLKCAGFPPFSLCKQVKTWQRLVVLVVNFLSFPS